MTRAALILIAALTVGGCTKVDKTLMPLTDGAAWDYKWSDGLASEVLEYKVDRTVAVGTHEGRILSGRRGDSELAWTNEALLAGRLVGTEFRPPLPLWAEKSRSWRGLAVSARGEQSARAEIEIEKIDPKRGSDDPVQYQSTITLLVGDEEHTLLTVFVKGKGIVRQEHMKGDRLVSRLVHVSGP